MYPVHIFAVKNTLEPVTSFVSYTHSCMDRFACNYDPQANFTHADACKQPEPNRLALR